MDQRALFLCFVLNKRPPRAFLAQLAVHGREMLRRDRISAITRRIVTGCGALNGTRSFERAEVSGGTS